MSKLHYFKNLVLPAILVIITTQIRAQQLFDTQAHRGGRALMPENTIPAMLNGIKLGVRTLELDCYVTADGKVMVSHDPFMSSQIMLKPDGSSISKEEEKNYIFFQMPYDSIRRFPAGMIRLADFPQQQVLKTYKPLLADLIDSVENYVKAHRLKPVYYNIETKSKPEWDGKCNPVPEVFVKTLMAIINEKKISDRVIIQSFDPRTLRVLHQRQPKVSTALLVSSRSYADNIQLLGFNPTFYSPAFKLVNADMIKAAHAQQVKVLPWTVEKEEDMKNLAMMGVDGIISDYPDRLVKLFGNYQSK